MKHICAQPIMKFYHRKYMLLTKLIWDNLVLIKPLHFPSPAFELVRVQAGDLAFLLF